MMFGLGLMSLMDPVGAANRGADVLGLQNLDRDGLQPGVAGCCAGASVLGAFWIKRPVAGRAGREMASWQLGRCCQGELEPRSLRQGLRPAVLHAGVLLPHVLGDGHLDGPPVCCAPSHLLFLLSFFLILKSVAWSAAILWAEFTLTPGADEDGAAQHVVLPAVPVLCLAGSLCWSCSVVGRSHRFGDARLGFGLGARSSCCHPAALCRHRGFFCRRDCVGRAALVGAITQPRLNEVGKVDPQGQARRDVGGERFKCLF